MLTMPHIDTFRTWRDGLAMSAHRGKADIPPLGRDFRVWTHRRRRRCARLSGKRILCGRYCPEGQLLAGRKSDAILWQKPPCQQLNEGENDALTPTRRARHY